jgi:hypothetical protein
MQTVREIKPFEKRDLSPSRISRDRPDNGSENRRGCGPSSEARKDNAHRRAWLVQHANSGDRSAHPRSA